MKYFQIFFLTIVFNFSIDAEAGKGLKSCLFLAAASGKMMEHCYISGEYQVDPNFPEEILPIPIMVKSELTDKEDYTIFTCSIGANNNCSSTYDVEHPYLIIFQEPDSIPGYQAIIEVNTDECMVSHKKLLDGDKAVSITCPHRKFEIGPLSLMPELPAGE